MTVSIFENHEQLSRKAADLFVELAQEAVRRNGRFCVALSGGDTPLRMYELLATDPWVRQMPWNETHIFWGDERCVPYQDLRHNASIVRQILLSHVPVPEVQIHPVICVENPPETAEKYESLLRTFFADKDILFDLFLLGVGKDGHVASLFEGNPAVNERKKWVCEVTVPGQAFKRITLTIPVIERSATIIYLVSGSEKAFIIKKILQKSSKKKTIPAAMVCPPNGDCRWLLDTSAASMLENK